MAEKGKGLVIRGDRQALPALYHKLSDKIAPLTEELIEQISLGLRKGLSAEDACKIAGISPHQFDQWYGAGKALLEQRSHNVIPELLPRQPSESADSYELRKDSWLEECDKFVMFFKLCNQSEAELNEELVTTIINYSRQDFPDSWKAAREALRMRDAPYGQASQAVVQHNHEFSGEVTHNHVEQMHTIISNLVSSAGTRLPDPNPNIIEGELVDEEDSD